MPLPAAPRDGVSSSYLPESSQCALSRLSSLGRAVRLEAGERRWEVEREVGGGTYGWDKGRIEKKKSNRKVSAVQYVREAGPHNRISIIRLVK